MSTIPVLAIDPGAEQSGFVLYDIEHEPRVQFTGVLGNDDILREVITTHDAIVVIEGMSGYGATLGQSTIDTLVWAGRFWQQAVCSGLPVARISRRDVKLHLCDSARARDADMRDALITRFGPGKEKAIGTKANRGPLYGVKSHCWAALALAVTYADLHAESAKAPHSTPVQK